MKKEMWDKKYQTEEHVYGRNPNDFLVTATQQFKPARTILSLGEGEGRNAVYLAQNGHHVTAVDQSDVGLEKAQNLAHSANVSIETRVADLKDFDMGQEAYDAIIAIFFHAPLPIRQRVYAHSQQALRPGGLFVMEAYAPEQINRNTGGPKSPEVLISLTEVTEAFAACELLHAQAVTRNVTEGILHTGLADVTQLVARKR